MIYQHLNGEIKCSFNKLFRLKEAVAHFDLHKAPPLLAKFIDLRIYYKVKCDKYLWLEIVLSFVHDPISCLLIYICKVLDI